VALLRSLNRPSDAISGLIQLLDAIPTDAEAWCELADLYQSQGLGSQAIFSLEEALLIAPNSWNVCISFYFIFGITVTNMKM
jgi:tetratricopeptide (TPR) repeat protein